MAFADRFPTFLKKEDREETSLTLGCILVLIHQIAVKARRQRQGLNRKDSQNFDTHFVLSGSSAIIFLLIELNAFLASIATAD